MARTGIHTAVYLVAAFGVGVATYATGASPLWGLALGLLAPLAVAKAPAFLLGFLRGAATPAAREQVSAAVQAMSGEQFEDYVALAARSCGLPVIMTPLSGDWGVDLVVGHRPDRLAIQCKRQARPVGAGAVQEVVAGAPMHDCVRTMVVTNHGFTPAARKLADQHGCLLVGGDDLGLLRTAIRQATSPTPLS